jgi:phosphoribosylformylglycinamidine synthase subunit PurS
MATWRYAVSVMPKPGILDPQGRAVETSLPHLGVDTVHGVRVGRRIELSVDGADEGQARETVERLAGELFANPLIEAWWIDGPLGEGEAGHAAAAPGDRRPTPAPAAPTEGTAPG